MAKTEETGDHPAEIADAEPGAEDDAQYVLNVYQRMEIAQEAFPYVFKPVVDGVRWRPVLHDDVSRLARAALLKAGIYALPTVVDHGWRPDRTSTNRKGDTVITANAWVVVQMDYINRDDPADRFSVTMVGEGGDAADKGMGKAISYACKFCHLKAFGVETGEDAESELNNFEAEPADTEAPEPEAPKEDPDERQELFEQLKETMGLFDLDPAYVRNEMGRRTGGRRQEVVDIQKVINSIEEDAGSWRDPDKQGK